MPTVTKCALAVSLCIPPGLASKAIGHKGAAVKDLRSRTGCSIHIENDFMAGTEYQVMRVKSYDKTMDEFLDAVYEILATIVPPGVMTSRPWRMSIAVSSTLVPMIEAMQQHSSCFVEVWKSTPYIDEHIMSIEGYTPNIFNIVSSVLGANLFQ